MVSRLILCARGDFSRELEQLARQMPAWKFRGERIQTRAPAHNSLPELPGNIKIAIPRHYSCRYRRSKLGIPCQYIKSSQMKPYVSMTHAHTQNNACTLTSVAQDHPFSLHWCNPLILIFHILWSAAIGSRQLVLLIIRIIVNMFTREKHPPPNKKRLPTDSFRNTTYHSYTLY